jgi:nucleotidyltransferase/DNA polymerase involved in DNA repair
MFACIHGPAADLPKIADAFSPWFEQTAPGTIVFRVDGLRRLYGSPQQIAQAIAQRAGSNVNIAIAETAESAILAARNFPGVTVDPQLDHLDISSLPITDEMLETLDAWGIHDLRQLAQLPESGIAERFGPAGVYLQRLAKGAIHRPLRVSGHNLRRPYRARSPRGSARAAVVPDRAHPQRAMRKAGSARNVCQRNHRPS